MALRDLITFNVATAGIRDSVQRISSIRRARQELEKKKEIEDLTIQEKKLSIEKAGLANNKTRLEMEQDSAAFKIFEKQIRGQYSSDSGKIDIAEMGEKNRMGVFTNAAKQAAQSPDVIASLLGIQPEGGSQEPEYSTVARNLNPNLPRVSYSKKIGPYTISSPKLEAPDKIKTVDKALGAIQSGGIFSNGIFNEFRDRTEAERYMSTNLGYNWQKKFPQAIQVLNKKYPELPGTVTKTSQAFEYLTTQAGMSREEAVQWIRQNNNKAIKVK